MNEQQSDKAEINELTVGEFLNKLQLFFQFLKRKWINLAVTAVVACFAGAGYEYIQPPVYQAESTFVLDEKGGGVGALPSLASSLGVDLNMMGGGGNLFAYDNILDIMQSRRIIEKVLLSEVDTAVYTHQTLADLYIKFNKLDLKFAKKTRTAGVHFNGYPNREVFSPVQDSILGTIYKAFIKNSFLTDRTNKKTQVFKVEVNGKSEVFCKLMAERIIAETRNLYVEIKTGTTQRNVDRLQNKADSLLLLLNGKSYESAETVILNANPAIKTLPVPGKLAYRNEMMVASLYSEVIKNLETAKTTLILQTPVIQMLDSPHLPLVNEKKSMLFYCFIFIVVLEALTVIYLFLKFMKHK